MLLLEDYLDGSSVCLSVWLVGRYDGNLKRYGGTSSLTLMLTSGKEGMEGR